MVGMSVGEEQALGHTRLARDHREERSQVDGSDSRPFSQIGSQHCRLQDGIATPVATARGYAHLRDAVGNLPSAAAGQIAH